MISKRSRYAKGGIVIDGQVRYLETRIVEPIPPRKDDRFHTITSKDTLDGLAYKYLKDEKLWWVIAQANGIKFAFDLRVGANIRIPSLEFVELHYL